jgi:hypothetical protein
VHVDVFAQLVAGHHRADGLEEVVVRVGHGEAHHLHRLAEPREVIGQPEAVHLAVALVPVGADPLEHVGGVEDRGAVDRQHRLLLGYQSPVHPDIEGRHVRSSVGGVYACLTRAPTVNEGRPGVNVLTAIH